MHRRVERAAGEGGLELRGVVGPRPSSGRRAWTRVRSRSSWESFRRQSHERSEVLPSKHLGGGGCHESSPLPQPVKGAIMLGRTSCQFGARTDPLSLSGPGRGSEAKQAHRRGRSDSEKLNLKLLRKHLDQIEFLRNCLEVAPDLMPENIRRDIESGANGALAPQEVTRTPRL